MKDCNQCGKCCVIYADGGLSASQKEIDAWEENRPDIFAYVSDGKIWVDPATGEHSIGFDAFGFLPEALLNFLVFLGWNPGTEQEIFAIDDLIQAFDLTRVSKGGARLDLTQRHKVENKCPARACLERK